MNLTEKSFIYKVSETHYRMEHNGNAPLGKEYHAVSFFWDTFMPILTFYDFREDLVETIELNIGMSFSFKVSHLKFCVGRFRNGPYQPCPNHRTVTRFTQCQPCASSFIPYQTCLFEPRCDGTQCDAEFCKKTHCVYLAMHNEDVKVGITGYDRVKRRTIEQGADAYGILTTVPSRLEARNLEKSISKQLKIAQVYRFSRVVKNLNREIVPDTIKEIYEIHTQRIQDAFELSAGPLHFLDRYPLSTSFSENITIRKIDEPCSGKIVGIKGKCLVFKHNDTYATLNLTRLPSRIIKGVLPRFQPGQEQTKHRNSNAGPSSRQTHF